MLRVVEVVRDEVVRQLIVRSAVFSEDPLAIEHLIGEVAAATKTMTCDDFMPSQLSLGCCVPSSLELDLEHEPIRGVVLMGSTSSINNSVTAD